MALRSGHFLLALIAAALGAALVSPRVRRSAPTAQTSQTSNTVVQNARAYPVEGVVVNSVTGVAIRNALVSVYLGGQQNSVLTGPEGKFHFENIPAGDLRITARKPGFFSEAELENQGAFGAALQVGPTMPVVTLKLVPESVIYGKVTDTNGEPASTMPVRAVFGVVEDGRRTMRQRFSAFTGTDGEFRMFELRPGTYYLAAGRSTITFYPGVPDIGSATPIRIAPGQQIQADLRMQPSVWYKLSGVVLGAPPGGRTMVEVSSEDIGGGGSGYGVSLEKDGRFTEMAAPGPTVLRATAVVNSGQLSASVSLDVKSDLAGLRLILAPTATIPVNVDFELTRPAPPELRQSGPPVQVTLTPNNGSFKRSFPQLTLQTFGSPPQQGIVALQNVEMGVYSVAVNPFGPWYVAAARRGATDLLTQDLVLDSGGVGEPIEVALRDDFARVEGTVSSDGQPSSGTVFLIPDRAVCSTCSRQIRCG